MVNARALSAYRAGASLAASPQQVLYLLHDEAARALYSAKFAYEQKALDQTCRHLDRAQRILTGLVGQLRFEDAGAAGMQLRSIYFRLIRRIFRIFYDSNISESLDDCAIVLQTLRDGDSKEIDAINLKIK